MSYLNHLRRRIRRGISHAFERARYLLKGIILFKDWRLWLALRLNLTQKHGLGAFRFRNGKVFRVDFSRAGLGVFQEVWLLDAYQRHYSIKPGDVVIDIGAHIGAFSVLAASKGASVYAYEPTPRSFACLKENTKPENTKPGRVQLFNSAVTATEGAVKLYEWTEGDVGNTTLLANISDDPNTPSFTAASTTFARVLENAGGRCDFLKIDCEGGELDILKSLTFETAKRIDHIALEYHLNLGEVTSLLSELGFVIEGRQGNPNLGFLYATSPLARAPQPHPRRAYA